MASQERHINVAGLTAGNSLPLMLLGGMNVLESAELADEVAQAYVTVTKKLGMPYVFKASFDKANRSRHYPTASLFGPPN